MGKSEDFAVDQLIIFISFTGVTSYLKSFILSTVMQEIFLSSLRALQPELCITAAYGNILPRKFLKIHQWVSSEILVISLSEWFLTKLEVGLGKQGLDIETRPPPKPTPIHEMPTKTGTLAALMPPCPFPTVYYPSILVDH
ncbi:hypothetical protein CK203_025258 [Vitis vinifera]|uniref:Uncharacterized protein n=1 Tax=Vitis vinifera TaxID=29760 RepID=A0A438JES6_VITVI|nr:hypothetical protein CK203_025258 [Vitis vinifera]